MIYTKIPHNTHFLEVFPIHIPYEGDIVARFFSGIS